MEEQILKLRNEGKSYREIANILGCSRGSISYHCGEGQKEKTKKRVEKKRNSNKLIQKVERFKTKKIVKNIVYKKIKNRTRSFQCKVGYKKVNVQERNFTYHDVIKKFGTETICYLSGRKINLINDSNYSLDHIVPPKKGGKNILANLGITHKIVNSMKTDLMVGEFLEWCKIILVHNGYEVKQKLE